MHVSASLPRLWAAKGVIWSRLKRRFKPWPSFWSLFSTALYIVSAVLHWPGLWQGMLLAVPLLIATTGWGWRSGFFTVPLGMIAIWLSQAVAQDPQPPSYYLGVLFISALSLWGGDSLYRLWRNSKRRAKRSARQAELLSRSVLELQEATSEAAIYQALPRLLAEILPATHAEVFCPAGDVLKLIAAHNWDIPLGFELPLSSVSGRAYLTAQPQHAPDTQDDPDFIQAPGAPVIRSELALPLSCEGAVVAVLNIEHTKAAAFAAQEQQVMQAFAKLAEASLLRLHIHGRLERQVAERGFAAHLNRQLLLVSSAEEAAQHTLEMLLKALGLETAAVLVLAEGRFRPLALLGPRSPEVTRMLVQGLPWKRGQLHRSWRSKQAIFIDDYQSSPLADDCYRQLGTEAAALVPVMNSHAEVQALLELPCSAPRPWSAEDREMLTNVADALGLALERTGRSAQLQEMLEVIRALAQADDPRSLYQDTVEAVVRLIPGCETASLLVRTPQGFKFRGVVGFDRESLEAMPALSDLAQLRWYGGEEESYRRGAPRILSGVQVWARSLASRGEAASTCEDFDRVGKTLNIRSNICVPIVHQQEVLGTLNLDSLTREDAFGQGELVLAEAFGQQLAVTIRQAQYREALERSVVTDALTGLGNRAGFNRHLELELVTAQRYRQSFSLLLLDLNNFKRVNDSLGHQAGDEALLKVAQALRRIRRESDSLYRWGGDEFALLLPKSDRDDAHAAARRYAEAITALRMDNIRLGASVGIASYPADGSSARALLAHADALLYEHKTLA
jgi:diguanylate cyclase (GGDEF)-like protein